CHSSIRRLRAQTSQRTLRERELQAGQLAHDDVVEDFLQPEPLLVLTRRVPRLLLSLTHGVRCCASVITGVTDHRFGDVAPRSTSLWLAAVGGSGSTLLLRTPRHHNQLWTGGRDRSAFPVA